MSEILLDRIKLCAEGSLELVVRVVGGDRAAAPSEASIRLVVRDSAESLTLPAALSEEGQGEWQATCVVSPDALTGVSSDGAVVDCFADVSIAGDVLSRRVRWDPSSRWLPYPTTTRKLSLTRVAA